MTPNAVFGQNAALLVALLDRLVANSRAVQYEFMDPDAFSRLAVSDTRLALQVYWREMLSRAHYAAFTGLIRAQRWIGGILREAAVGEMLTFAACFRGLLESCADANATLNGVPFTLAEFHTTIRRAIRGTLTELVLCGSLEDRLIHFTHARRINKGTDAPSIHRALAAIDYLKTLGDEDGAVLACYAELCEYTHPSARSVLAFVAVSGEDGTSLVLRPEGDTELIPRFCRDHAAIMPRMLLLGTVPALLTLMVLNQLPVQELHTSLMESTEIEISVWPAILTRLNEDRGPAESLVTRF